MIATGDKNFSIWQDVKEPLFPTLNEHIKTDVCVIGSGIAGMSIAYDLIERHFKVVVIDAGEIGGRQTLRTTAHISNAFDDRYFHIKNTLGQKAAETIADSHTYAIRRVQEIIKENSIVCDFTELPGLLFLAEGDRPHLLEKEYAAAVGAGLKGLKLYSQSPESELDFGPCLFFPRQAKFHPAKYVLGLAEQIQKSGGEIFRHTKAAEIHHGKAPFVVTENGKTITADKIVVATNVPVNTTVQIHTKQAAYRSYVIAGAVPDHVFPHCLMWDTGDPYHYVRSYFNNDNGQEYLIIGGEDHKTGQQPLQSPFEQLEFWGRKKFPFMEKIEYRWSGQIIEPVDGVAYIGELEKNLYIVTGDSGNGITHGVIAGRLISDLISDKKNPWTELYDPHRVSVKSTPHYLQENLNAAWQYKDWTHHPEKSKICTHLGGIVHWNELEQTWDCPVHGSRFGKKCDVINGPAVKPLDSPHHDEVKLDRLSSDSLHESKPNL
jgi:glycine/D-amino acid oxidase-like deaminating enzyme